MAQPNSVEAYFIYCILYTMLCCGSCYYTTVLYIHVYIADSVESCVICYPPSPPRARVHPAIQARIRHLFMTSKQIRDERLRKYRVGFMGMRIPRSFDEDD